MGECKTKAIQTNIGTFRHNQAYPGIIQAYSGIFRTLCYPDIFKTVVYPEPWHIQNQKHIQNPGIFTILVYSEPRCTGILRTLAYSKPEAYPEHCQTSAMKHFVKAVNGYNYFLKLFSQYNFAAFFTSWNKYQKVFTPDVVMLCKKVWHARGWRNVSFWYTYWYIEINSPICS